MHKIRGYYWYTHATLDSPKKRLSKVRIKKIDLWHGRDPYKIYWEIKEILYWDFWDMIAVMLVVFAQYVYKFEDTTDLPMQV